MTIIGLKRRFWRFAINYLYVGTKEYEKKRVLMEKLGHEIGEGTKIVGPIFCTGKLVIGKNCWIGKNLIVNGNGVVTIGDNCDIAPEVAFQTGGHIIGTNERRAGEGIIYDINVGSGCWLGARSTVLGNCNVGNGCVVSACSCVATNIEDNCLVGGVPAKVIRKLEI